MGHSQSYWHHFLSSFVFTAVILLIPGLIIALVSLLYLLVLTYS